MLGPAVKYSIVIPTYNEMALGFLIKNLRELSGRPGIEVICIDGGSLDRTTDLLQKYGVISKILIGSNRAQRINAGLLLAKGEWIVVLHPRSLFTFSCLSQLQEMDSRKALWGAWTHSFDVSHPLLKFTSWYSNFIRGDQRSIYYFDHCWYLSRNIFEKLNLPVVSEVDIFEDTEFCLKLRKINKGLRLSQPVVTSAIRFAKSGFWRQGLLNQILKIKYLMGLNQTRLNQVYEADLQLNGAAAVSKDPSQIAKSSFEIQQ